MSDWKIKYQKMNEFLLFLRDIAIQNETLSFQSKGTMNAIYSYFVRQGVDEKERSIDLSSSMFPSFIRRYQNVSNIDVFVAENWKYFCQFTNRREEILKNGSDAIKMYIPLDSMHVEKGANIIFDYLAQNNIAHLSKIGKHIRFDNIVVRLKHDQDAVDLFNFIQEQPYIKEGLIDANPFAFHIGNIAFASDKKLSYNHTLTQFLTNYVDTRKREGNLNNININDFLNYGKKYYQERFMNYEKIEDTMHDFMDDKSFNEEDFVNVKEILDLFLASSNPNFSFHDYLNHYHKISDQDSFYEEVRKVKEKRKQEKEARDSHLKNIDSILLNMIDTVSKQYDQQYAYSVLNEFLRSGKLQYLTRENNVRRSFIEYGLFESLPKILRENNASINEYCDRLLAKRKERILEDAVVANYQKYQAEYERGNSEVTGKQMAYSGLAMLVKDKDYNGFTRSNNARSNLVGFVPFEDAYAIMRNSVAKNYQRKMSLNRTGIDGLIVSYANQVLEERNIIESKK